MKLINQSFEILKQEDFTAKGIWKFIERCARVSYKSEYRITDDSYKKFVQMLIDNNHSRPLEFGTVHLRMNFTNFQTFKTLLEDYNIYNDIWLKYNEVNEKNEYMYYITTNYRYYREMCEHIAWLPSYLDYEDSPRYLKRYTVHMILSRGVMDEFRTHIGLSHLAESTRYCNYSKDKFNNELTFIKPLWFNDNNLNAYGEISTPESLFIDALNKVETIYMSLLQKGWKPQQAREVLPLSIKSELISCGFIDAWRNFFIRRCDNTAHPQAKELTIPLMKEFEDRGYINT